uniref:Uncharacterized protein n=1 Tax=Mycena chlorophos TaxID=658473 RepID=A0ABQ0M0T6_MYCCL|nr:predicted protein [Mycena chlorophos]
MGAGGDDAPAGAGSGRSSSDNALAWLTRIAFATASPLALSLSFCPAPLVGLLANVIFGSCVTAITIDLVEDALVHAPVAGAGLGAEGPAPLPDADPACPDSGGKSVNAGGTGPGPCGDELPLLLAPEKH